MSHKELTQYLVGLESDMSESFYHLAEIIKYEAFEICRDVQTGNYLVPYMMNDALEYYLILTDSRMTGEFLKEEKISSAQIIKEDERYILILRQESSNTCTVMFRRLEEHARCYQYHRIGHYWREGQEHWRRLVYMIGTIYDKYEFFGDRFCTLKEKELMHLICFAPFRYWSPIGESLDDRYPDAQEGLELMFHLAQEAKDIGYLRMLTVYRYLPLKFFAGILAKELLKEKHYGLYELICRKIDEASMEFPQREYEERLKKEIDQKRAEAQREMKKRGYEGTYPHFIKDGECVLATEEHPFTLMEWEDYVFRIQFLKYRQGHIKVEDFEC